MRGSTVQINDVNSWYVGAILFKGDVRSHFYFKKSKFFTSILLGIFTTCQDPESPISASLNTLDYCIGGMGWISHSLR